MIVHSSTKDTLFNLAFGIDIVIPMKIGINTPQVVHFDPEHNEDNIRANLDLLEEASIRAVAKKK